MKRFLTCFNVSSSDLVKQLRVSKSVNYLCISGIKMDWKGTLMLKNVITFWKSDQTWGSYGLDNQNILNRSLKSPVTRRISELRWCLHWKFLDILNVKALTPSILVWFSKSWWLNISVFQDLSFDAEHPRGTWPHAHKCVLKLVHEKWESQKLKKFDFPSEG